MSSGDQSEHPGRTYHLEDLWFEGPSLNVPDPPPGLPYAQYEDYRRAELLAINGIPPTEEGLLGAIRSQTDVLLAAAAHVAGSKEVYAAVPLLGELLSGSDHIAVVEAAYSLVRLGVRDAKAVLKDATRQSANDFLSAIPAAGYLAQLGDPTGFTVVRHGLGSELVSQRMLACKQLYFFVPFDGQADSSGDNIDVLAAFEQTLGDAESDVQWQALAQLRILNWGASRRILEAYLTGPADEGLREIASNLLETLSSGGQRGS